MAISLCYLTFLFLPLLLSTGSWLNKPFPPQPDDMLEEQFPEALSTFHLIKAEKGLFSHHSRSLSGVQTLDWTGQGLLEGDGHCQFSSSIYGLLEK